MIVSRVAERARLDALLAALVRGEGGALVVHGEAGIGKTALLETLVERCVGVVTVARACGAETELRAAGGRVRSPQDDDGALTPQERRVAAAVRRGASNRDIAADLFLSPKTVEFHLRQIYRKLDVHSRSQLVAALAAEKDTAS